MVMMVRLSAFGLAVSAVLLEPVGLAHAGGTRASPAVRVVAPTSATGIALERDDLPPPQLEVVRHPVRVELPAIPAFDGRAAGERARTPGTLEIEIDNERRPELRNFVDDATLDSSLAHLAACNKALVARLFDSAIASCRAATKVWPDNHLAWYAMAGAHLARQLWSEARVAAERAVALRPDRAMYQMYRGIALYEIEHRAPPSDPRVHDGLAIARDALVAAIRLAPGLWRAHYYLGRVYRDLGEPGRAAEQLTSAIAANPRYRASYIALAELYRARNLFDQALAVALLGTVQLPERETAELWLEAGMAYDGKRSEDRAVDALQRALALEPGDTEKRLATELLDEIAQRRGERPAPDARWDCGYRRQAIECRRRVQP